MFDASLAMFTFGLIAAIAGGFFGAAVGGNFAFALTGFSVLFSWGILMGTGSTVGFDYIAFGPFMGPHVAFAAGVGAAAYAGQRGYVETGKDATSPLARLGRPDVLWVGSLFGAGGFVVQIAVSKIPWFGSHTDSVALTVVLSAIVARLIHGRSMLNLDRAPGSGSFISRIAPTEQHHWLTYQQKPSQYLSLGAMAGILAGGAALMLATNFPGAAPVAQSFTFAVSALCVLFLNLGAQMPVTHHITISAGLAAITTFRAIKGPDHDWLAKWDTSTQQVALIALVVAAAIGMLAAWLAEFQAALFYYRGATHFDPPAAAIWICNTVVVTLGGVVSGALH